MPKSFFYKIVILIDQILTNKNCEFSLGKICCYKIRKCPDTFVTGVYMIYGFVYISNKHRAVGITVPLILHATETFLSNKEISELKLQLFAMRLRKTNASNTALFENLEM